VTVIRSARRAHPAAGTPVLWLLRVADAGLLVASGLIHLHLWDIAYRHVGTLDVLFPLQFALCLVAAVAVLALPRLIVVVGAGALVAGTMVGFVLARTVGIFGFHLTFSSGLAWTVLAVEAAALAVLALTGWALIRARGQAAPVG
jgi:hypothetical protein